MVERLNAEQRERLYELFDLAIELQVHEREAFCQRQCGDDDALLVELSTLLAAMPAEQDAFLAEPVLSMTPIAGALTAMEDAAPDHFVPDPEQVGRYHILGRLGEGGMGVVYRAEQNDPVQREVALKVIKPGMDTERVIRRFEAERQTLARMDHPGIAGIYDAGTTAEGRPWFAMEVVDGEPITTWCHDHRLPTRARLELFGELCDAVQHAHQKGVIHRDLKPSNVLVTTRDGKPRPVIIDFGIARAMSATGEERTLLTRQHEMLGTLDYMAPEQADPGAQDVDSRADIYSLGVVLYELLTGERPFDNDRFASTRVADLPRVLRDRVPPTPSTRVRVSEAGIAAAASQRSDARGLRRTLRGELDWITIKALEPMRERRYASASELAVDVRRFLANEPVLAGPPGRWYRVRTFVRRNRLPVAAAAAILLTVLIGSVVTVLALLDAQEQRDNANLLSQARLTAVTRAEAFGDFMFELLALTNPENQPDVDNRGMLDYAAERVASAFPGQPLAEAKARRFIGRAYATLNENALAVAHLARALELYDGFEDARALDPNELYEVLWDLRHPLQAVGQVELNWNVAARFRSMTLRAFCDDHPDLARTLFQLAMETSGELAARRVEAVLHDAEVSLRPQDSRWLMLADHLQEVVVAQQNRSLYRGRSAIGEQWFDQVAAIYERLRLQPSNLRFAYAGLTRSWAQYNLGQFDAAVREAESLATMLDKVPTPGHLHFCLGRLYWGLALVETGKQVRGFELIDEGLRWMRDMPNHPSRIDVLELALGAGVGHGDSGRTPALRKELGDVLLRNPKFRLWNPTILALGSQHADLIEEMRACNRQIKRGESCRLEVEAVIAACRERFPTGTKNAAVAAAALLGLCRHGNRGADIRPSVLAHCIDAFVACPQDAPGPEQGLLPIARRMRVMALLEADRLEEALLVTRSGYEGATGPQAGYYRGVFLALQGHCLDRLARDGAEPALRSSYDTLRRLAGLAHRHTDQAHSWLQDFLRADGRNREAITLAHQRLEGLIRQTAVPGDVIDTILQMVCHVDAPASAIQLGIQAIEPVLALRPDMVRAHLALGVLRLRSGLFEQALDELLEAQQLHDAAQPGGASVLPAVLAIAYARLDRLPAARAQLLLARAQDPQLTSWARRFLPEAEAEVAGR